MHAHAVQIIGLCSFLLSKREKAPSLCGTRYITLSVSTQVYIIIIIITLSFLFFFCFLQSVL